MKKFRHATDFVPHGHILWYCPYDWVTSKSICSPFTEGAIRTVSSAYIRWLMVTPFTQHPTGNLLSLILRLSINKLKRWGLRIPPCLTPLVTVNDSEKLLFHLTYIF